MTVVGALPAVAHETPRTPAAQRILDAAGALFYEHGITAVGVDLLAERAGTTKKTLYDRFGSKDGLVLAYLEGRMHAWQTHVLAHLAGRDHRGIDRVLDVLDALETWLDGSERGCGFVNAYAELSTRSAPATAVVRAEKQWMRELYAHALVEAGWGADDPRVVVVARQVALIHEGVIVELGAGGSPEAFEDGRQLIRAVVQTGVPAPGSRH